MELLPLPFGRRLEVTHGWEMGIKDQEKEGLVVDGRAQGEDRLEPGVVEAVRPLVWLKGKRLLFYYFSL